MIIEKNYDIAGIDYNNSKLKINSINWVMDNKHYNVNVIIDTDKNLCVIKAEKTNWFANIVGLRDSIPEIDDVKMKYVEKYRPFLIGPIKKRVIKGWVELKKRENVSYTSNCFTLIER